MSKTVGIIGLGLLGGSLAKALKAYTDYEVVGYARRQEAFERRQNFTDIAAHPPRVVRDARKCQFCFADIH